MPVPMPMRKCEEKGEDGEERRSRCPLGIESVTPCKCQCYSSAVPFSPDATSRAQSCLQRTMSARSFLSPSAFSIHCNVASSSSGTKNEESSDSTVSKFADSEVM